MIYGKKTTMMTPAGKVTKAKAFKPCAKCPSPAKCTKTGACAAKSKK